jgi:hypothetical protein
MTRCLFVCTRYGSTRDIHARHHASKRRRALRIVEAPALEIE